MANINWTEDSLEELLEKSIGDIREMLAHEDADIDFKTFLVENGWIESEDEDEDEEDDNYDEDEDEEYDNDDWDDDEDEEYDNDDWDDDEDEEYDDDDWDDDEDEVETPSNLSSEEEALAQSIASDIDDCKYSIDAIRGLYDSRIIERIEYLID